MSYGAHDALADVIVDLRNHTELVGLLDDSSAIDEGWPKDAQDAGIVVRVQPVTESSNTSREHKTIQRTFRMQISVVAKQSWRSDQQSPTYRMAEIMSKVGDRLEVSVDAPELLPDGAASGSWETVTGDRIALIQDWRVSVYTR